MWLRYNLRTTTKLFCVKKLRRKEFLLDHKSNLWWITKYWKRQWLLANQKPGLCWKFLCIMSNHKHSDCRKIVEIITNWDNVCKCLQFLNLHLDFFCGSLGDFIERRHWNYGNKALNSKKCEYDGWLELVKKTLYPRSNP